MSKDSEFQINIGDKYNRLLVVGRGEDYVEPKGRKRATWQCLCDCGNLVNKRETHLRYKESLSCGCLQKQRTSESKRKHGMTGTRIYNIWSKMKARCDNPSECAYKDYGGRGITYDQMWTEFEFFLDDMLDGYDENLELDRTDVNGDYCKNNCRWVGQQLQAFNKRLHKNNKSGKSGVFWDKQLCKWEANIRIEGKRKRLGFFDNIEDAIAIRLEWEIKIYGFNKE